MSKFENEILLQLKRKYSKDEELGLLIQNMKRVEYENGVLKSELAELRAQPPKIIEVIKEVEKIQKETKIVYRDETAEEINKELQKVQNKLVHAKNSNAALKRQNNTLRQSNFQLIAQLNKKEGKEYTTEGFKK